MKAIFFLLLDQMLHNLVEGYGLSDSQFVNLGHNSKT